MQLNLPIHRKWFDLILSGIKLEEYRALSPHWIAILTYCKKNWTRSICQCKMKEYTTVKLTNGYGNHRSYMIVELKSIEIGLPNPNWCDDVTEEVFILKLGTITETGNL